MRLVCSGKEPIFADDFGRTIFDEAGENDLQNLSPLGSRYIGGWFAYGVNNGHGDNQARYFLSSAKKEGSGSLCMALETDAAEVGTPDSKDKTPSRAFPFVRIGKYLPWGLKQSNNHIYDIDGWFRKKVAKIHILDLFASK